MNIPIPHPDNCICEQCKIARQGTISVSINFGPKLEPLVIHPFAGIMNPESVEVITRCNELLAKIEIIEQILNNLSARHR